MRRRARTEADGFLSVNGRRAARTVPSVARSSASNAWIAFPPSRAAVVAAAIASAYVGVLMHLSCGP